MWNLSWFLRKSRCSSRGSCWVTAGAAEGVSSGGLRACEADAGGVWALSLNACETAAFPSLRDALCPMVYWVFSLREMRFQNLKFFYIFFCKNKIEVLDFERNVLKK